MPYPTCRHLMENGSFCQSPALAKRDYCFFHIEFRARRIRMARARALSQQWWLDLPCIEDMRSCQAANARVFEALAADLIDPDRARVLFTGLRQMASNFKASRAWGPDSEYQTDDLQEHLESYPNFEARHGFDPGTDLDADPLTLFPMPEIETASPGAPLIPGVGMSGTHNPDLSQILRDAELPIPGHHIHVTADDMELWEIADREGEKAAQKRAAELERNRRRSERRIQRARFEEMARNRNIQLAAQALVAAQQRQAQQATDTPVPPDFSPLAQPELSPATADVARKPPHPQPADTAAKVATGTA